MSKNKNRRREETLPNVEVVTEKIPLVSVVVPMFNAAKFISQTLESLLYQTLKNFEVVVVDDCSTDNSVAVVESFSERFNGRLKIVKLPKNTGTPGLPRNVGIQLARGKYISFLDCDDLYTKTALEELSTLAEKFQADVVRLWRRFILWNGERRTEDHPSMTDFAELTNPKNFSLQTHGREQPSAPTVEPEGVSERVRKWLQTPPNDFWGTGLWFYRRDLLVANQIYFSTMPTCEDLPIAFEAMCLAKKIISVPNIVYIIRPRIGSVSREDFNSDASKYLIRRTRGFKLGLNEIERILDKINFFRNKPNYRYAVLEWFANYRISVTLGFFANNPLFTLYELLKKEFHPDDAALAAYLFNTANVYRIRLIKLQQELAALKQRDEKVFPLSAK